MLAQGQVERYVEDSRAEARKALDRLLAGSPDRPGRRFVHLLKGDPAEVIAEFAKTGRVDLIVMGTRGRGRATAALFGSTSLAVLHATRVPVLVTRDAASVPSAVAV